MIEDNLEQERERLRPFLNYRQVVTGDWNSVIGSRNDIEEIKSDDADHFDWYENAFNDEDLNEISNNNDWFNVDLMDFGYSKRSHDVPVPLFHGSTHTGRDLARFILSFKSHNSKVGDNIIAEIVGMFASFLPAGELSD
jgi:hypothetical protein